MSRTNRWSFTVNNPGDWRPEFDADHMCYLVSQLERGNREGTEHIQGYVRFSTRVALRRAKTLLGRDDAHMELTRGTEEENKRYCTKEDTRVDGPWEHGTYDGEQGKQGRRSDLEGIAKKLKEGTSLTVIAQEHPGDFIRYHRGLEALADKVQPLPPKKRLVRTVWIWGESGTGKTHQAMMKYSDPYPVVPGRDPWGAYQNQKVVLFDEFDWTKWSLQEMNRLLDEWRLKLDCRYRDKWAAWNLVIIISNTDPLADLEWMQANPALKAAFRRRISEPLGRIFRKSRKTEELDLPPDPETTEWVAGSPPPPTPPNSRSPSPPTV